MSLSIIIVSYNTRLLLQKCLSSLLSVLHTDDLFDTSEIIVVDNASSDGSVDMVKKDFPHVHLIQNEKNVGFAQANNQGIQHARGTYLLLLNSDTQIQKGALFALLTEIQKPKIGAVGGKLLNDDGSLQFAAGNIPHLMQVISWMFFLDDIPLLRSMMSPYHIQDVSWYSMSHDVGWVSGACFLTSSTCVQDVGRLDDHIFMYGEEVEWCFRMNQKGYVVRYIPEAHIVHTKGGSSPTGPDAGIVKEFQSIIYFYQKHKPAWQTHVVKHVLRTGAWLRIWIFGIIGQHRQRRMSYEQALTVAR